MKVTLNAILSAPLKKACSPQTKVYTLTQLHKRYQPYCPWVTGTMYSTVDISPKGIEYEQEYAHRQYTGDNFNFTKDFHPLACARWAEVAFELQGDILINDTRNYILKE